MTDERLAANAKDAMDNIDDRLAEVDSEWKYNVKVLIAEMREYVAMLDESMKDSSDKYAAYEHFIDCKNCVLDAYDTLRRLYHDAKRMREFLAMLNKGGEE
jgi:hypothetical protein